MGSFGRWRGDMWGTGFWFDEGAWASGARSYAMASPPSLYVSREGGSQVVCPGVCGGHLA